MELDVAVVGGGPAGAAAALALARMGRTVGVLETSFLERHRYGETVPPEVNPLLLRLGAWGPFSSLSPLESPGTVSIWGEPSPHEQDFVANAHGCGWHLDRRRFDEMLLDCARDAGARVVLGSRVNRAYRGCEGSWRLAHGRSGATADIQARVVIDATGRNGLRLDGPPKWSVEDVLVAVALRVRHPGGRPADLRTYVEGVPGGWWYAAPIPGNETVAMFFTDLETYRTDGVVPKNHLTEAPLASRCLRSARLVESRVLIAPSAIREPVCGDGWIAVGDSASSLDPLCGFGIVKGLRDGLDVAEAVHRSLDGEPDALAAHARLGQKRFTAYRRLRRTYYEQERRWAGRGFWQRRLRQRG
jgi:flavin-dependent dehydrogenase